MQTETEGPRHRRQVRLKADTTTARIGGTGGHDDDSRAPVLASGRVTSIDLQSLAFHSHRPALAVCGALTLAVRPLSWRFGPATQREAANRRGANAAARREAQRGGCRAPRGRGAQGRHRRDAAGPRAQALGVRRAHRRSGGARVRRERDALRDEHEPQQHAARHPRASDVGADGPHAEDRRRPARVLPQGARARAQRTEQVAARPQPGRLARHARPRRAEGTALPHPGHRRRRRRRHVARS